LKTILNSAKLESGRTCRLRHCCKCAKAKAYTTCIAPQATYRRCSDAVHVTDSGRGPTAYSLRPANHIPP